MYGDKVQFVQAGALSDLIAFDSDGRAIWPSQQLRTSLRRQLGANLQSIMADAQLMRAMAAAADPAIETFEQLLHHAHPPIDLLWMGKEFAKLAFEDPGSPLPPDVALVIYYGCIAAALLRHAKRISRLSEDDLRSGLNWAVRQDWVDEVTRKILMEGLGALRSSVARWRA